MNVNYHVHGSSHSARQIVEYHAAVLIEFIMQTAMNMIAMLIRIFARNFPQQN
ncbi:MAG: hypothetical protein J0G95_11825 [Rhizobiales bacterium]|nr:hypothetical protein [Hyphomicrobiales bacterium]